MRRREALPALAAGPLWAQRARASGPLSGDALFRDVQAYSDLGEHRTATQVDLKTADWLERRLRAAGLKTEKHPFSVRQFFVEKTSLMVDGRPAPCFPMWQPRATGPTPVRAPLVKTEPANAIALVRVPATGAMTPQHTQIIHKLAAAGALGVVAVTAHASGELMALNTYGNPEPWPIPVVLVGSRDEPMLEQAAARRAAASLLILGREEPKARAFEVVGKLDRGCPLVVISTPYSGWFRCAGERGPGIALWLAMARWAAARKTAASYLFVASSGHELDNAGIRSFLAAHAPKPEQVHCWIHLGAGIAAYDWEVTPDGPRKTHRISRRSTLTTNRPHLVPLLERVFAGLPPLKPILTDQPAGEMALMARAGFGGLSFAGIYFYHHAPADLPDKATSPDLLASFGSALVRAVEGIEAADGRR